MKIHARKKVYRAACKRNATEGRINTASGTWVQRSSVLGAMSQHYSPQTSSH